MTYQFDRYINGVLMAEGVTIERAENVNHAMKKAAKLASKGPREETPVLVLKTTDEIERLREALQPFAELGAAMMPCDAHDTSVWVTMPDDTPVRNLSHYGFRVAAFRNAAKALGEKE